jgi:SET domain-containing protein
MSIDTDLGQEKKIVVFANRDILAGEEITYGMFSRGTESLRLYIARELTNYLLYEDYKFPVEDGSLRCTCGAPNCIGRLN